MNILNGFKVLCGDFRSLLRREIDFYKVQPRASTLYLTYRCNSKCKTCTMWKRPQEQEIKKEIGLEDWKIIVNKLAASSIRITEIFGGNVLLRKEVLIPLLAYLYEKGIAVHLPTNQIGLDEEIAEAIAKYVDSVYISIDGVDHEQDNIRGIDGASLAVIESINNILKFKSVIKSQNRKLRLVCNCTISKLNYKSMENIVHYAENKGFDEVHFEYAGEFKQEDIDESKVMGIVPRPHYVLQGESILANKHEACLIKRNIKKIKKNKKTKDFVSTINIDTLSEENLWNGTIPHKKCYVERNEVTIDPYGNMVACPFFDNFIIGNILDMPMEKAWNNDRHKAFRKAQNHGELPMCSHCILGVQRNPGIMKTVQRIYLKRIEPYLC